MNFIKCFSLFLLPAPGPRVISASLFIISLVFLLSFKNFILFSQISHISCVLWKKNRLFFSCATENISIQVRRTNEIGKKREKENERIVHVIHPNPSFHVLLMLLFEKQSVLINTRNSEFRIVLMRFFSSSSSPSSLLFSSCYLLVFFLFIHWSWILFSASRCRRNSYLKKMWIVNKKNEKKKICGAVTGSTGTYIQIAYTACNSDSYFLSWAECCCYYFVIFLSFSIHFSFLFSFLCLLKTVFVFFSLRFVRRSVVQSFTVHIYSNDTNFISCVLLFFLEFISVGSFLSAIFLYILSS